MTADVKLIIILALTNGACIGQGRRKHQNIGEQRLPVALLDIEKGT
jgi:hypothetical protein